MYISFITRYFLPVYLCPLLHLCIHAVCPPLCLITVCSVCHILLLVTLCFYSVCLHLCLSYNRLSICLFNVHITLSLSLSLSVHPSVYPHLPYCPLAFQLIDANQCILTSSFVPGILTCIAVFTSFPKQWHCLMI